MRDEFRRRINHPALSQLPPSSTFGRPFPVTTTKARSGLASWVVAGSAPKAPGTPPTQGGARVADRTVTGALGWRGGDRLTLTAEAGVVVIRRDPAGLVTLPPRSCVPIPAALRHRCGLLPGDPVLLTAVPAEDTLTAYSLTVVDQALRALIPFPAPEGDR